MITIEQVIEFFEQDYYTGDNWEFVNNKEAAAVVRAQHEEIERLRAELDMAKRSYYEQIEEIGDLIKDKERLNRERDKAYKRVIEICEKERVPDTGVYADDATFCDSYNAAIECVIKSIRRAIESGEPK